MEVIDTAIVGAGPYGLSIAAHLRAAGAAFEILGEPMESWRNFMPQGMLLRSEPFASTLWDPQRRFTYWRYLAGLKLPYRPVCDPIPLERFLDYAEWFKQHAVGKVRDAKVRRVRRDGDGFALELADGQMLAARRVVIATGHMAFRRVPAELSGLGEECCVHSTALRDLHRYAGRDVTVVGAGQSALESAALLHEAGATVRLIARRDRLKWHTRPRTDPSWIGRLFRPESGIGAGWQSWATAELPRLYRALFEPVKRHRYFLAALGPSGAWWLRERVEGKIEVLFNRTLGPVRQSGNRVYLTLNGPEGASEIATDHVVAATGFEVAVDRIECLDASLKTAIAREGAYPALSRHFETSVPGLYIVGLASAPVFGPVLRFMFGAKHAAPIVSRRLARARASSRLDGSSSEVAADRS